MIPVEFLTDPELNALEDRLRWDPRVRADARAAATALIVDAEQKRRRPAKMEAYLKRKACTSKKWLSDEAYANKVATDINTRDTSVTMKAYKCDFCDGWHLTRGAVRSPILAANGEKVCS